MSEIQMLLFFVFFTFIYFLIIDQGSILKIRVSKWHFCTFNIVEWVDYV